MGHLTSVHLWLIDALTYKTDEGDKTGPEPSCFLRSKNEGKASCSKGTELLVLHITSECSILERPPQWQVH
jgi:hypothetical protein